MTPLLEANWTENKDCSESVLLLLDVHPFAVVKYVAVAVAEVVAWHAVEVELAQYTAAVSLLGLVLVLEHFVVACVSIGLARAVLVDMAGVFEIAVLSDYEYFVVGDKAVVVVVGILLLLQPALDRRDRDSRCTVVDFDESKRLLAWVDKPVVASVVASECSYYS